jgi:hypothetical protein
MLDIHQLKRLVSEPKSGALFEYFFLSPTLKLCATERTDQKAGETTNSIKA